MRTFNPDGSARGAFTVFDSAFTGDVRVVMADFNKDGVPDLVVGTGPGAPTQVRVLDGRDQHDLFSFAPFESLFRGGVFVAAGDLNGDGFAELIAGGGPGGGPRIFALSGRDLTANQQVPVANFFAGDVTSRGVGRVD